MKIGVIYGGNSLEHDVSIITGLQVMKNLDKKKYQIIPLYLDHNNELYSFRQLNDIKTYSKSFKNKPKFTLVNNKGNNLVCINKKFKKRLKIDLIFNCTHGFNVEDGTVASWLNLLNIPHTSSNLLSSSICQDKDYTKTIMKEIDVKVLDWIVLKDNDKNKNIDLLKDLSYPVIIKPAHLGSSIGINIANDKVELIEKIKQTFLYDNKIIIERLLNNFKEYAVGIYKRKNKLYVSKIEIINIDNQIFDFNEKYINHHKYIEHQFLEDEKLINKITSQALKAYNKLEMNGIVRFDFLEENNEIYLNEINTIPGGLANYLFKDQITFKLLLDEQIREAFFIHQQKNKYFNNYQSTILKNTKITFKK